MRADARKTGACALFLLLLNTAIIRGLFSTEYTRHMGSIEAAYISISRYITANWSSLTWFPLWYGGIPFQNTYPPVLHLIVAAVSTLGGISAGLAHHAVTAFFYCFGSVTLFWLVWRLSGDRTLSLISGLLYSLISPSAFLMRGVANDINGAFHARRLFTLVQYGEGPHVTSLALLPVAIVALDWAIRTRRPTAYLLTALSMASVVLTNWLGGFSLAMAVICYLLARQAGWRDWMRTAAIGVYAYLLAAPWIPPATLQAIRTNAQWIGGDFRMGAAQVKYFALAALFCVPLYSWLRGRFSICLRFALWFTLVTGSITLGSAWFGLAMMPQPQRYHLALEMAVIPLLVFGCKECLPHQRRTGRIIAGCALILFCFLQFRAYRFFARNLIQPIDIRTTTEYKEARWFDEHMLGKRIFAPGTISFWLNAFTDTPQFGGGFDQGLTNSLLPAVQFQIYSGMGAGDHEGEIAVMWLKALGVHATAIGGPKSGEFYKPIRNPDKYKGLLPELWRDGDDAIYAVSQRSASLARVVRRTDLVPRTPNPVTDIAPLRPYVAALDDPSLPLAEWTWRSRNEATAVANLKREHVLSIQMAYHPGWRARVNGQARPVSRDNLNQLLVEPDCDGPCTVDLTFDGGTEMALARVSSWGSLALGLYWILRRRRQAL